MLWRRLIAGTKGHVCCPSQDLEGLDHVRSELGDPVTLFLSTYNCAC